MSNVFNLDSLREELDREFAPLTLTFGKEQVVLRNLMRISDTERKVVLKALEEVEALQPAEGEEESQSLEEVEALGKAVHTVLLNVTGDGKGQKLVDYIGGDLMMSMKIMEQWTEATQPGEAENSSA